jgi:hypothetical protein
MGSLDWIVVIAMITVGVIRNGSTYLSRHLRKNDYWAEERKSCLANGWERVLGRLA